MASRLWELVWRDVSAMFGLGWISGGGGSGRGRLEWCDSEIAGCCMCHGEGRHSGWVCKGHGESLCGTT